MIAPIALIPLPGDGLAGDLVGGALAAALGLWLLLLGLLAGPGEETSSDQFPDPPEGW